MSGGAGEILSVLQPTANETALLAACLLTGDSARTAWNRWRCGRGKAEAAVCAELAAARTLLPLLARSAVRNDFDLGRDIRQYVRAATLREELRAARFRQIASEVLSALERAGAEALVVRGAALAATVYDDWALRHCHDLDLLLAQTDLARAAEALERAGCAPVGRPRGPRAGTVLRHGSGLEIALHSQPFAVGYYEAPIERFAQRSATVAIGGVSARAPAAEATFVHVLGHATYSPSRGNLRWVADAWHLLARRDLDWDDVLARIETHRLALPVAVLATYLAELGAGVPPEVLTRLAAGAAGAPPVAHEVALGGAHAGPRGDLGSLWRSASSWRGRARLVRWILAPSPAYLRSAFALPAPWLLPACYVYRPARFVARRLRRHATRPAPRQA